MEVFERGRMGEGCVVAGIRHRFPLTPREQRTRGLTAVHTAQSIGPSARAKSQKSRIQASATPRGGDL